MIPLILCFITDNLILTILFPLIKVGQMRKTILHLLMLLATEVKGTADLHLARRMAQFESLQKNAQESGARGANLGHV